MENNPPGRFVPVIELLEVGLAVCVVSFFNNPRKRKSAAASSIERHWVLEEHSPLLVAFIATTIVADAWAQGEDLHKALWVGRLHCALDSRPEEDFLDVAKRLLNRMEGAGSTLFKARLTFSARKKYYVMADDDACKYLVRETAKERGHSLQSFADDVLENFLQLEAFVSDADSFRKEWKAARVAA